MPRQPRSAQSRTGRPVHKRRRKIVDAAARVFAERGYHGASTQDIADLLGMRQASLYYYFDSKETALEEVCVIGTAGFVEAAEEIVRSGESAEIRLGQLMTAHVAPLADKADYMRTFLNERKWLPMESRRRIGRMSRRLEAIFERVIREGMRSGEFRSDLNPRMTTLAILGMLNAVTSWYDHETVPLDRIAELFADLALKGTKESGA